MLGWLIVAAIQLTGVTGDDLRARAFFDANNVKVGDPLVLTVDFVGRADFQSLHPPALSRHVDRRDWKLDDVSAKTDTYRDARRLTYRVRPMREGVLWFPALEFEYAAADGSPRTVRSNEIPVHAKGGAQVVVAEMGEDLNEMPQPDPLCTAAPAGLDEDALFAWRKACAKPTAAAFAAFDFPEAKLNEARCELLEGNWAKALRIYGRLEWSVGQTPAIERGIVAALAQKYDNPRAELPVWRQVGRPVLKYGWLGRVGIVLGALAGLALVFWIVGRGIKAVACLALALALVLPAGAQDLFRQMHEQMQRMHEQMQRQMQQMSSGFSFGFGEKEERDPVTVKASLALDRKTLQVGDEFAFILSLEAPRNCTIGQIQMTPSETFGMTVTGQAQNLEDGRSLNPSNVVKRLSVPVRYDVPFDGRISFHVEGMVSGRMMRNGGRFSFTYSNSFGCDTAPIAVSVRPLPSANQPKDYGGLVSEGLRLHEYPDLLRVETNDVVKITYRLHAKGYVPPHFLPAGMAFEWSRNDGEDGSVDVEYVRYFVADGAPATPEVSIPYYNPRTKSYIRVKVGGTGIQYKRKEEK